MPKDGTSGKLTGSVNRAASGLSFPCANNLNEAYESYCKMLLTAAKKNIPRGIHKAYVPCWDDGCDALLCAYAESQNTEDRDKAAG